MSRLAIAPFLFALVITPIRAEGPADHSKDQPAKCDAYMQARIKYSKFSGTVLVARDGKVIYEKGFGLADAEQDAPNTPQTKFRLASVSKQFTATGIMILEHEGKLKLDDPISKYVPDVPDAWAAVTLHQLLTHTGGVPENLRPALFKGLWPQPMDKDHLFDHIKKQPLDFKPGEKWSYSNSGYALLGLVIEKIADKPYGDFLKERIFDPLGMKDTGVDSRRLVLKHRAHGYGTAKNELVHAQYIDLSQVFSAGSLYSTVGDLLKWDNALYTDKILPQKLLEKMWTPVKSDYGYGWLIAKRFDKKLITHGGGLPGFMTTVDRYPDSRVFVCVLCNLEGSAMGRASRDLAAVALDQPYDIPVERIEAKVDPKIFDALAGEYEVKPGQKFTISRRDDGLFAQLTGQGRFRILPESETKFFARVEEVTIAFTKDKDGNVTGLTLHQNGKDLSAKRLPAKEEKKEK